MASAARRLTLRVGQRPPARRHQPAVGMDGEHAEHQAPPLRVLRHLVQEGVRVVERIAEHERVDHAHGQDRIRRVLGQEASAVEAGCHQRRHFGAALSPQRVQQGEQQSQRPSARLAGRLHLEPARRRSVGIVAVLEQPERDAQIKREPVPVIGWPDHLRVTVTGVSAVGRHGRAVSAHA